MLSIRLTTYCQTDVTPNLGVAALLCQRGYANEVGNRFALMAQMGEEDPVTFLDDLSIQILDPS